MLYFGTVVSIIVGLGLVNVEGGVASIVSSCTLPVLPALFVSHSFVSAETPKMTLHYTY
jgi:cytochrome c biogenesis protein CcdA